MNTASTISQRDAYKLMLKDYTEALDETFLEFAPLRRRVKLVSACSHSFWKDEQHRQRFAAAQAIFGIYRKRNTPAYYAALFLLTSDDSLFRRTADCVRKKKIDFQFADVRNMTVSQYALYKTAKSLYNESSEVSIHRSESIMFLKAGILPKLVEKRLQVKR